MKRSFAFKLVKWSALAACLAWMGVYFFLLGWYAVVHAGQRRHAVYPARWSIVVETVEEAGGAANAGMSVAVHRLPDHFRAWRRSKLPGPSRADSPLSPPWWFEGTAVSTPLHRRSIRVPFWIPFLLLVVPTSILFWKDWPVHKARCRRCRLDLSDIADGTCPACGDKLLAPSGPPAE